VGVFVAIGVPVALTRDSVPAGAHVTVLAGGIWIAVRLCDTDAGGSGRCTVPAPAARRCRLKVDPAIRNIPIVTVLRPAAAGRFSFGACVPR
jgi:hypothetical protein